AESELIEFENVQVVGDGYRLADIVRALEDREGFAESIKNEAEKYTRRIHVTAGIGVVGIIALTIAAWALPDAKALLLGFGPAWTLLLVGLVIPFDSLRQSLRQSEEMSPMDDQTLHKSVSAQASGLHAIEASPASETTEGDK